MSRPEAKRALHAALIQHGATKRPARRAGYRYIMKTVAGNLMVSPYEPSTCPDDLWVHARFAEPIRAEQVVNATHASPDALNTFSGKWNFTSHDAFIAALARLMQTQED
ncbi:MAG: hypothetical protein GY769_20155 [bacterium]|nr:hypothetical protein [bacterium]